MRVPVTARRLSGYDRLALLVLALTLVARILIALWVAPPVVTDAQGYEAAAFRLAQNGTFAFPLLHSGAWAIENGDLVVTEAGRIANLSAPRNAYTLPGYPALRALIIKAVGDTYESRVWTRLAQALLSVLSGGLIYLIGRRFGARVGLLALVLAALYPPFAMANTYLQTEVLFTFLLVASVYWFARWSDSLSWIDAVAAGAVFGLSLWVRPAIALWSPLAAALVVLCARPPRGRAILQAIAIGATIAVVIAPWWIRNAGLYERFVPFSTSGAVTTIEGIRMDAAEQLPFPWQSRAPEQSPGQTAIENLALEALKAPSPDARDDVELNAHFASALATLQGTVLEEYRSAAVTSRLRSFAVSLFWPFAVSKAAFGGLPFLVSWLIHLAIVLLFIAGVALAPRRTDTWLLLSLPIYTLLLHLLLIPLHRYYFPAMPAVVVLAAIGFDRVLDRAGFQTPEESGPI